MIFRSIMRTFLVINNYNVKSLVFQLLDKFFINETIKFTLYPLEQWFCDSWWVTSCASRKPSPPMKCKRIIEIGMWQCIVSLNLSVLFFVINSSLAYHHPKQLSLSVLHYIFDDNESTVLCCFARSGVVGIPLCFETFCCGSHERNQFWL